MPAWVTVLALVGLGSAGLVLVARPRSPGTLGPGMMALEADRRASIRRRAALAVLLTVGFYALALGVAGVLLIILLLDLGSGHFHIPIVIPAVAGIYGILSGILPREEPFAPPGPRITAEEHPRLFGKLEAVASKAGQPMPDEVYLLPDLNAWVADVSGAEGRRRIMGIGFPLLQVLDVSQLCSVISHEFVHYYGGDTQLGPWIYRTRKTIEETISRLSRSHVGSVRAFVHAPFAAYGRMFLRVTQSVSRQQEYTADRFAAAIVSP